MRFCCRPIDAERGKSTVLQMAGAAGAWEVVDARTLAAASEEAYVELSPGVADEIDLSLEDAAWEGAESEELGDEGGGQKDNDDDEGEGKQEGDQGDEMEE